MYEAHLQYGYTLKEIAEYIGVHYTTVSRTIKKMSGKMKSNIVRPGPIT
jgi:DNA-binding MarR family transcriptional regulator